MSVCLERAFVGRHFDGVLSPRDERAMRLHLADCDECRALYERHLLLSRLDPTALSAEERIGRGLGIPSRRRLGLPVTLASIGVAAAASVLLLVHGGQDGGFAARGNPPATASESRVFLYDVDARPRPLRAGDSFARGDDLALAYENAAGKSRLMVFGVDEHRHVYWFYPAWTREDEDPVAITIAKDAARHELPDAVRHTLDGSTLDVHALFVDDPVTVRQVEALISRQADLQASLPGSFDSSTRLTIAP